MRLLNADAVNELWDEVCGKCKGHLEGKTHLVAGRQQK
jgi:hypothetical protein